MVDMHPESYVVIISPLDSFFEFFEVSFRSLPISALNANTPTGFTTLPRYIRVPDFVIFVRGSVPHVLRKFDTSKICYSIVRPVLVYVVDNIRPFSMHPEPRDAMCKNCSPANLSASVAMMRYGGESLPPCIFFVPRFTDFGRTEMRIRPYAPNKCSAFRVIVDTLTNVLLGERRVFSHCADSMRFGQGWVERYNASQPANDNKNIEFCKVPLRAVCLEAA